MAKPSRARGSRCMAETTRNSICCMSMRCKPALSESSVPLARSATRVSALKPLLTEVLCKGRILTTDAAQSYHEFGRLVKRAGGDVILIMKDNTPATRADLELFFEDPQADRSTWQSYEQIEKGHGRLERRHILTSPDLNEFLYRDWGDVGQVFRVQRERTCKEKHSVEV